MPTFISLIKSLELDDNMEIIKPVKRIKPARKELRKEPPKKSENTLKFNPFSSLVSDDDATIYSTSEDEVSPSLIRLIPPAFNANANNKRRNDNSVEIEQPSSKRIRFEEFHCAYCDFVCNSNVELEQHFTTDCPRGLPRGEELNPFISFSSSDSSDL